MLVDALYLRKTKFLFALFVLQRLGLAYLKRILLSVQKKFWTVKVGDNYIQQVEGNVVWIVPCFGNRNNNNMKEITFKRDKVYSESSVLALFASVRGKSTMAPSTYLDKYIWNNNPHSGY